MFYGRTFELKDEARTIIEPCSLCGTPIFPLRTHECVGFDAARRKLEISTEERG